MNMLLQMLKSQIPASGELDILVEEHPNGFSCQVFRKSPDGGSKQFIGELSAVQNARGFNVFYKLQI